MATRTGLLAAAALTVALAACGGGDDRPRPQARPEIGEVPPFHATFSRRVKLDAEIIERSPELAGSDYVYVHSLWYRDENAWRRDIIEDSLPRSRELSSYHRGGAGSFIVWDGQQLGAYNAVEDWFYVRREAGAGRDEGPLDELGRGFG